MKGKDATLLVDGKRIEPLPMPPKLITCRYCAGIGWCESPMGDGGYECILCEGRGEFVV
jgi:hypothetical protein